LFGKRAAAMDSVALKKYGDNKAERILRSVGAANFPKTATWKPRYEKWTVDPYMCKSLGDPEWMDSLKAKHLPDIYDKRCLDLLELVEAMLREVMGVERSQEGIKSIWTFAKRWEDVVELAVEILAALGYFKKPPARTSRKAGTVPEVEGAFAEWANAMDVHSFALQFIGLNCSSAAAHPFWWVKGAKKTTALTGMARRFVLW
jgi:hypothetical protein